MNLREESSGKIGIYHETITEIEQNMLTKASYKTKKVLKSRKNFLKIQLFIHGSQKFENWRKLEGSF